MSQIKKEQITEAIKEANSILDSWLNMGKSYYHILSDLNGMIKSLLIKNMQEANWRSKDRITSSFDIEAQMNAEYTIQGITILPTTSWKSQQHIYDTLKEIISAIDFKSLIVKREEKSIQDIKQFNFKSIEEITF